MVGVGVTVTVGLGEAVSAVSFDHGTMWANTLSPQHHRATLERSAGPMIKLVQALSASDPAKLDALRREYEALISEYLEDNVVRQDYLLTRAIKV